MYILNIPNLQKNWPSVSASVQLKPGFGKSGFMSEDAAGFLHLQTNMPNPFLGNDKIKIVKFLTFTYFVNLQDLPDRF